MSAYLKENGCPAVLSNSSKNTFTVYSGQGFTSKLSQADAGQ